MLNLRFDLLMSDLHGSEEVKTVTSNWIDTSLVPRWGKFKSFYIYRPEIQAQTLIDLQMWRDSGVMGSHVAGSRSFSTENNSFV